MQGQLQGAPGAPKKFMFSLLRNKADVNLVKGVWHESFFFFFLKIATLQGFLPWILKCNIKYTHIAQRIEMESSSCCFPSNRSFMKVTYFIIRGYEMCMYFLGVLDQMLS